MKNRIVINLLMIAFFVLASSFAFDLVAQCPMCRMSAETNLQNGGTEAKGLNTGILYLLSLPYLLIGGLAYLWYTNKNKEAE